MDLRHIVHNFGAQRPSSNTPVAPETPQAAQAPQAGVSNAQDGQTGRSESHMAPVNGTVRRRLYENMSTGGEPPPEVLGKRKRNSASPGPDAGQPARPFEHAIQPPGAYPVASASAPLAALALPSTAQSGPLSSGLPEMQIGAEPPMARANVQSGTAAAGPGNSTQSQSLPPDCPEWAKNYRYMLNEFSAEVWSSVVAHAGAKVFSSNAGDKAGQPVTVRTKKATLSDIFLGLASVQKARSCKFSLDTLTDLNPDTLGAHVTPGQARSICTYLKHINPPAAPAQAVVLPEDINMRIEEYVESRNWQKRTKGNIRQDIQRGLRTLHQYEGPLSLDSLPARLTREVAGGRIPATTRSHVNGYLKYVSSCRAAATAGSTGSSGEQPDDA